MVRSGGRDEMKIGDHGEVIGNCSCGYSADSNQFEPCCEAHANDYLEYLEKLYSLRRVEAEETKP